jgi:hypothetical protein
MLVNRIIRAIKLDKTLYTEVKPNEALTNEAITVIILAILAGAIGQFFTGLFFVSFGSAILRLIVHGLIFGTIGIGLFIFLCQFLGQALYKGTATLKEMIRTLGYAQAPAILSILVFIPVLGWLLALIGTILTWVTSFIALRETEGFDNTKTIVVLLIAAVAEAIIVFGVGQAIVF